MRKFSVVIAYLLVLSPLAEAQDSLKAWRRQLKLGALFANGQITFPRRDVLLGDDVSIRLENGGLARQYLMDLTGSWRLQKFPLEPYFSVGYWHFYQWTQVSNFRWREDRLEFPPGSFQVFGDYVEQHRLSVSTGAKMHLTNWLYIRGGLSLVATLSSADWEGGLSTRAAMDVYRPAFELHKYWQPTHWYGSYGAGVQGWGFFAEYYQQHSLNSFVSHIPFRGVTYRADFGRNSNYGIAVGYRASLARWQGLFSNKPTSRLRMATLF